MNNRYIMQVDTKAKAPPGTDGKNKTDAANKDFDGSLALVLLLIGVLVVVAMKSWPYINRAFSELEDEPNDTRDREAGSTSKPAKVVFNEASPSGKPRSGLKLDDVNDPPPRQAAAQKPSPATTPPPTIATPQTKPTVIESSQPTPGSAAPGDFEKALAQAGQRMDSLLAQTVELTRQLKLAEKAKTDVLVDLNKATGELNRQLGLKDEQIAKLDAQLDRKSSFPSLRALIEVKKLCCDMLNTQKEVSREELVNFLTAEIDSQLANLEVQLTEFSVGTPLEKIPGEQVEIDRRHEPTDDPAKANQVARLLRPCYYLERDSKRIIVAKALVILHRYTPPAPAAENTPSTPSN